MHQADRHDGIYQFRRLKQSWSGWILLMLPGAYGTAWHCMALHGVAGTAALLS